MAAVFVAMATAVQAGAMKIGDVEIPADCALAKGERPRLLIRGSGIEKYRARIAGPMKADFDRFKVYWDNEISKPGWDWNSAERMDGLCVAVLYQLTGERRYADAVRKSSLFKKGSRFWVHPFTMDLIFDTLSTEEIEAQVDNYLKDAATKYRWGDASTSLWAGLVLKDAGSRRQAEIDEWLANGLEAALYEIDIREKWAGARGGDANSFSYIGNHTLVRQAAHVTALANALGMNSWGENTWIRTISSYYIYNYLPWYNGAIHFDNTTGVPFGPTNGEFGASYLLYAAPARYRDGLYQWWVHQMHVFEDPKLTGWPKKSRHMWVMRGLWGRILFYDPTIPMLEPKAFPPSRLFRTRGASMRESWDRDATFVHFRLGIWDDLGDGRHNADQATFTIYKKGILALDSGGQHELDANALKLSPGGDDHSWRYSSEMIAHNGILVYHQVTDPEWQKLGKLNTGGQFLRREPADWSTKRGVKVTGYNKGRYLAWETSPEYDYVAGDATYAYSPDTVKSFTRQIVYVRPDLVFIFDRVETAIDGTRTTWLLHIADRPKMTGTEKLDKRIHPEGHFLWEGDTAIVTDQEMGGRLFVKTLLPARRETRLLGGENHDFELPDGSNVGPTAQTYALPKNDNAMIASRAEGEGVRSWRIEVIDDTGSRSVRFLHVMQTGDRGLTKMVPTELVRRGDMVGAEVRIQGGAVEVLFADSGAVGGSISISMDGQDAVGRTLATQIEDHYDRWKNHPDYDKWMTDPFRRSVVLGNHTKGTAGPRTESAK